MMTKREEIIYRLFPFLILIPFFIFLRRYFNIDFWYDEVFTLTNYVFSPIKKTLTDYSFPNNHILANLINNLYLKIFGIKDIYQLLEAPYKIRLLEFIYTLITLFYLHQVGKKFFNQTIALFTLVIFVTTVTYYNFALQVRGFSLSIMLSTILFYYLLSFLQKPNFPSGLIILFATAFILYAIPSNLYLILAIFTYYFFSLFFARRKKREKVKVKDKKRGKGELARGRERLEELDAGVKRVRLFLLSLLLAGIFISILFYSPVLRDVLSNRFVQSRGLFYLPTLSQTMPFTFSHFLSGRYLFIPIIIFGLISYGRKRKRFYLGLLIFILLLPFFFSFIRGDRPYHRVFVILTPFFALFLSILTESILDLMGKDFPKVFLVLGIVIYNYLTFGFQLKHIERKIANDITEGIQSQDLNYNYYQFHYRPFSLLKAFKKIYETNPLPVFLGEYDRAAFPVYLAKFNIPWGHLSSQEDFFTALKEKGGVYVITAFPNRLLRWL
ncbi:MAG: glycosyltransferase family 39 protein, partial [candidate division WOR-3 bacterium]